MALTGIPCCDLYMIFIELTPTLNAQRESRQTGEGLRKGC